MWDKMLLSVSCKTPEFLLLCCWGGMFCFEGLKTQALLFTAFQALGKEGNGEVNWMVENKGNTFKPTFLLGGSVESQISSCLSNFHLCVGLRKVRGSLHHFKCEENALTRTVPGMQLLILAPEYTSSAHSEFWEPQPLTAGGCAPQLSQARRESYI